MNRLKRWYAKRELEAWLREKENMEKAKAAWFWVLNFGYFLEGHKSGLAMGATIISASLVAAGVIPKESGDLLVDGLAGLTAWFVALRAGRKSASR